MWGAVSDRDMEEHGGVNSSLSPQHIVFDSCSAYPSSLHAVASTQLSRALHEPHRSRDR